MIGSFNRVRRAVLLVDFDNVKSRRLAALAEDVVALLERGDGDPEKPRRRFVAKIVYWNVREGGNRQEKIDAFVASGFEFKATNSIIGDKSTADTVIAFDIGDLFHGRPRVQEFILLSSDSDFLPVLERLREDERMTAVYARPADTSEGYWNSGVAISDLDALIDRAQARAAARHARRRRFIELISAPGRLAGAVRRGLNPVHWFRLARRARNDDTEHFSSIEKLAEDVIAHMRAQAIFELDISGLAKFLSRFPDFEAQGPASKVWFGFGNHRELMRAIVGARADLRVSRGPRRGRRRTLKLTLAPMR